MQDTLKENIFSYLEGYSPNYLDNPVHCNELGRKIKHLNDKDSDDEEEETKTKGIEDEEEDYTLSFEYESNIVANKKTEQSFT